MLPHVYLTILSKVFTVVILITLSYLFIVYLVHISLPRHPNKGGWLPSPDSSAQTAAEDGL